MKKKETKKMTKSQAIKEIDKLKNRKSTTNLLFRTQTGNK